MNKDGKGVFFSTHITSDLDKIADMLIMIDSGQIVFQEEKAGTTDKSSRKSQRKTAKRD